jgi:hypothetical protein
MRNLLIVLVLLSALLFGGCFIDPLSAVGVITCTTLFVSEVDAQNRIQEKQRQIEEMEKTIEMLTQEGSSIVEDPIIIEDKQDE